MRKITMGTYSHTQEEIDSVVNAIRSNMLSTGPELLQFENSVSKYHNKEHGIMVNSGQNALEVSLELAKQKLQKDDLVVAIPATTYAATLWAVIKSNCIPILYDVDNNYVINYSQFMNECEGIDVLMPVDLCGYSAEPPQFVKDKYFIIQDACEAFGNKHACYGDIICHSFYVSHIITTGAGGMLSLNDGDLAEYARSYIAHGRTYGGDFTKFNNKWVDRFLFDRIGVSYRPTNIEAALGLAQMGQLSSIIKKRQANARLLSRLIKFSELKDLYYYPSDEYIDRCVFQFYPIVIKTNTPREKLLSYLFDNGIDSRVLLSLTNQPAVVDYFGVVEDLYPNAAHYNKNGFIIGCHQGLGEEDITYIFEVLRRFNG